MNEKARKRGMAFVALGSGLIVLGVVQRVFLFVGMMFLVIGLAMLFKRGDGGTPRGPLS